jgi:hypothetical protein
MTAPVTYEPATHPDLAGLEPEWCWDCGICYRNQFDIPDEVTARQLAEQHAAGHGVKAGRG